jgi:hypothetical protein
VRDDEDLETLFAVRLQENRLKFWSDIIKVIILVGGLSIGFLVFGALQYWTCKLRIPNITPMQCFRGEYMRGNK